MEFRFGFKVYADAHPDEVGKPEMDEVSIPIGDGRVWAFQVTTNGKLEWVTGGSVRFYPKASALGIPTSVYGLGPIQ